MALQFHAGDDAPLNKRWKLAQIGRQISATGAALRPDEQLYAKGVGRTLFFFHRQSSENGSVNRYHATHEYPDESMVMAVLSGGFSRRSRRINAHAARCLHLLPENLRSTQTMRGKLRMAVYQGNMLD
ncbi:hypothetical protein [Pandoraea bronchicola]|uniref:hypothetical protein n=1 Tax=Pandoraea bronchicola TaxID=2508287 RepID=UPI00123F3BF6|nr:hypothetical protein [Pandoraea bronchicola]